MWNRWSKGNDRTKEYKVIGILKDCGVHYLTFHCIIHQKEICTKFCIVTNTVNIIKGRNLRETEKRHGKFKRRRVENMKMCQFTSKFDD